MKELTPKKKLLYSTDWFPIPRALIRDFEYPKSRKPYLLAIYTVLASHADGNLTCYPSQTYIAEKAHTSIRLVKYVLADMEKRGLIRIHKNYREDSRYRARNEYQLRHPAEWVMSAGDAPKSGHHVPTNKSQTKRNKNIEKIRELSRSLAEKKRIYPDARSP